MKRIFTILALLLLIHFYSCRQNSRQPYNLDFEKVTSGNPLPDHWMNWGDDGFTMATDSEIKQEGRYSVMISSGTETAKGRSAGIINTLPVNFKMGTITLEGYIKTEAIENGFAGLVLQTDQNEKIIDYRDMHEQQLTGTHDWKKYSVTVPFHPGITQIFVGGTLSGTGKAWFDSFDVLINGDNIGNLIPGDD